MKRFLFNFFHILYICLKTNNNNIILSKFFQMIGPNTTHQHSQWYFKLKQLCYFSVTVYSAISSNQTYQFAGQPQMLDHANVI